MNDIQKSDEIDLIQLIETIWDGKRKIIAIAAACVLGVFSFQTLGPAPSFIATTEIKPILASDAEDYHQANALGFLLSIVTLRLEIRRSFSQETETETETETERKPRQLYWINCLLSSWETGTFWQASSKNMDFLYERNLTATGTMSAPLRNLLQQS